MLFLYLWHPIHLPLPCLDGLVILWTPCPKDHIEKPCGGGAGPILMPCDIWWTDSASSTPKGGWDSATTGIILGRGLANQRCCYNVMSSLIDWAHTQNDPCTMDVKLPYDNTQDFLSHLNPSHVEFGNFSEQIQVQQTVPINGDNILTALSRNIKWRFIFCHQCGYYTGRKSSRKLYFQKNSMT